MVNQSEIDPKDLNEFKEAFMKVITENQDLREDLSNVTAMLSREDEGWLRISGGADYYGPTLYDLYRWSEEIRESMAGNPHIKRGHLLRASYVWDGGIHYTGVPGSSQGRGTNVQAQIDRPVNQKNFFGSAARTEREGALYSDGNYFALGTKNVRTGEMSIQTVPIWEIVSDYRNPENPSEIWAYHRQWSNVTTTEPVATVLRNWYRTDSCPENFTGLELPDSIEQLVPNAIIFDGKVNGQAGWAYGVPDAAAAVIWARMYKDFLLNGKIMSDALAQFAFKAAFPTKAAATNASMKLATAQTPGSTAVLGIADSFQAMPSAGKGYDFSSGNALLAVVATAIEVSLIHLSSDPGTSGASYGSAATLDLPTQLAIKARRQWHIDFDTRVLKWMGAKAPVATFKPMEDSTNIYRMLQAIVLKWSTGLYSADEIKTDIEMLWGRIATAVPDGVMIPNNTHSLDRLDIDTDGETVAAAPGATPPAASGTPTAVAPRQGKNNPAGKSAKDNSTRTDRIAQMLTQLQAFVLSEEELEREQKGA